MEAEDDHQPRSRVQNERVMVARQATQRTQPHQQLKPDTFSFLYPDKGFQLDIDLRLAHPGRVIHSCPIKFILKT